MLYSQLIWVYSALQEADGIPTKSLEAVYADNAATLKALQAEWQAIVTGDVAKLNESARKLDLPTLFVPPAKPPKKPR
jgi:hypothetical protein